MLFTLDVRNLEINCAIKTAASNICTDALDTNGAILGTDTTGNVEQYYDAPSYAVHVSLPSSFPVPDFSKHIYHRGDTLSKNFTTWP